MKRRTAACFAAALVLASWSFGWARHLHAEPVTVQAARIPLYFGRSNEVRAGQLIYRGGLYLTSNDSRFGGFSDLEVSATGDEILAVSDRGRWLRARLSYDENGSLSGLQAADITPMLGPSGRPFEDRDGDAEGLTLERPNDLYGPAIVSFERHLGIWRYDLSFGSDVRPTNVPIGDWFKRLRRNSQLESLALVEPGTLIVFGERKVDSSGGIPGALEAYPGNAAALRTRPLSIVPRDPFAVTSVAKAPDGGLYVLERRFSFAGGVGMELRHIPASNIKEGARLDGPVLADLAFQNSNIDNMEGLAVRRGPNGQTLLYMISDNNFLRLQRTLLLMFEVKSGG